MERKEIIDNPMTLITNWKFLMQEVMGEGFSYDGFVAYASGVIKKSMMGPYSESGFDWFIHDTTDREHKSFRVPIVKKGADPRDILVNLVNGLIEAMPEKDYHIIIHRARIMIVRLTKGFHVIKIGFIEILHGGKFSEVHLISTKVAREQMNLNTKLIETELRKNRNRSRSAWVGRAALTSPGKPPSVSTVKIDGHVRVERELYPALYTDPVTFFKEYMASKSCITFFVGDEGTGKSSLIRYGAKKHNVILVDDHRLLNPGNIHGLMDLILRAEKGTIFVFEEIDSDILPTNGEGTEFTKALLQVSNGVVRTKAKIMICTNGASINKMLPSLTRGDRCFGVFTLNKMTAEQANAAARVLGKEEIYTEPTSLSDIFNGKPNGDKRAKIGFLNP